MYKRLCELANTGVFMRVYPNLSSSVQHIILVFLGCFLRWEISGRSAFVLCCCQNLFVIACNILLTFPWSFFSKCFTKAQVVQPYKSTGTAIDWKNFRFILSGIFDFYISVSQSIAVHAFPTRMLTSFSVDKILLPRYVKWSININLLGKDTWSHISVNQRCLWRNAYRRRKWSRRHEFKSWTRLIAFHIALIPLGKVWIRLFSLQLWVNRIDWVLQPWWGN